MKRSNINIFNADGEAALKDLPDNAYDLAIVDPPYGIKIGGESGKVGGAKPFGARGFANAGKNKKVDATTYEVFDDSKPPDKAYFDELLRVSKNQIIWGANHFIDRIPYASSCWVVWDKDNTGNFADAELAWTSFKTAVRVFKWRWNGLLQQNMKNKEKRIHPTQKPAALYRWLLQMYASDGNRILDTHGGSGSIAVACHDLGYDLDLYEIKKSYYDGIIRRLNDHRNQLQIFKP